MKMKSDDVTINLRDRLVELGQIITETGLADATPTKPRNQLGFAEIALGPRFRIDQAISVCLAAPDGYHSIREILFLGICGWVVSPDEPAYGELLMRIGVGEYLAGTADKHDWVGLDAFQVDFLQRYVIAGNDFLSDIFNPIGGYAALARTVSRDYLQDWHHSQVDSIQSLVTACRVLHFAAVNFGDENRYHPVSQNRARLALQAMKGGKSTSRSVLLGRWRQNSKSLALLYAASTITVKRLSLLDAILTSEVTAQDFMPKLEAWVRRARYFSDVVIAHLESDDLYDTNVEPFKTFEALKFNAPKFTAENESIIRNVFLRGKAVSATKPLS